MTLSSLKNRVHCDTLLKIYKTVVLKLLYGEIGSKKEQKAEYRLLKCSSYVQLEEWQANHNRSADF